MALQIVDACAQIGSGDRPGDVLESGVTVQQVLANMDAAGVQRSVLYPTTWTDYSRANAEVDQAIRAHRDRFIGFARVNPTAADAESVLRKALTDYGFRGVRLRPFHDGYSLRDPGVARVVRIAGEHRLPVGIDGERSKDNVVRLVRANPDVPILLMHLGSFDNWVWKNTLEYVGVLQDNANFFIATCFEIIHFLLEDLIRKVPTKVVFGSDSPTLPPIMELARIEVMHLEPAEHAMVVGGNLLKILGVRAESGGRG